MPDVMASCKSVRLIPLFALTKAPTEFLLNDVRVQNHAHTNDILEERRERWNARSKSEKGEATYRNAPEPQGAVAPEVGDFFHYSVSVVPS
jgi:hypothetical protein